MGFSLVQTLIYIQNKRFERKTTAKMIRDESHQPNKDFSYKFDSITIQKPQK